MQEKNQKFNTDEDAQARYLQNVAVNAQNTAAHKRRERGMNPIWQARLVLLVMINIAQLWILQGTIEAALAREFSLLSPLIIASGVCWLISLSIFIWWKPTSRRYTSTGYIREKK